MNRFGSAVSYSGPILNEAGTRITGSIDVAVNSTTGVPGGDADNVSFLAIRPGHVVEMSLYGTFSKFIDIQAIAREFSGEDNLNAIFAEALSATDSYVFNMLVDPTQGVTARLTNFDGNKDPLYVYPLAGPTRVIRFALDTEQNFTIHVNGTMLVQHKVAEGLIESQAAHVILAISGFMDENGVDAYTSSVDYFIERQMLISTHDYAVAPDFIHYGQTEDRSNGYKLLSNPYYAKQSSSPAPYYGSKILVPMDGSIQKIAIPVTGLVGAITVMLLAGEGDYNRYPLSPTNALILSEIGGGSYAGATYDPYSRGDTNGIDPVLAVLEGQVFEGSIRMRWYLQDNAGGKTGYDWSIPIALVPETYEFAWLLTVHDLFNAMGYVDKSAIVTVTSPETWEEIDFGGESPPPDYATDIQSVNSTSRSDYTSDQSWAYFAITADEAVGTGALSDAPGVVLTQTIEKSDPYAFSIAFSPDITSVGDTFYLAVPYSGAVTYQDPSVNNGFPDVESLAAFIKLEIVEVIDELSQTNLIYLRYTVLHGESAFPDATADIFLGHQVEFMVTVDSNSNTVLFYHGKPANWTAISSGISIIEPPQIAFFTYYGYMRNEFFYGLTENRLIDLQPIELIEGYQDVDVNSNPTYVMEPATVSKYDTGGLEPQPAILSVIHQAMIDFSLDYPDGGKLSTGYIPDIACTVIALLSLKPNNDISGGINSAEVRANGVELEVTYAAGGEITSITRRRYTNGGSVSGVPLMINPPTGTGWAIGAIGYQSSGVYSSTGGNISVFKYDGDPVIHIPAAGGTGLSSIDDTPLFLSITVYPNDPANPGAITFTPVSF